MKLFKKIFAGLLVTVMTASVVTVTPVSTSAAIGGSDVASYFNGHTYALFKKEIGWKEAKEYCEKSGGHLVTITSEEENNFLVENLLKGLDSGVSIGFSDEAEEGNWKWVTGENVVYTNWNSGEPNDEFNEDFALIKPENGWNDGHLDREQWAFICEWDCVVNSIKSVSVYAKAKYNATKVSASGVTYKSSNTKVAKVDAKGVVKTLKKGSSKIIATYEGKSDIVLLTVKNPKLNKKKVTLKAGKSFKLKVVGKVGKAKFSSSNKKVAKVNSKGKIVAKKKGTATIKVKTNGITLKCKVKVK